MAKNENRFKNDKKPKDSPALMEQKKKLADVKRNVGVTASINSKTGLPRGMKPVYN